MTAESTAPRSDISFGYTIVYVDDVDATLRFFTDAFGIERVFLTPEGDYGELATGSTALAFASTDLARANLDTAGGFAALTTDGPPPAVTITLLADDVAAAVDAALAAGAHRYVDPIAKPWGQTVAYVLDPNGLLIELATPIEH
ncbi:MAG: VOC family protein [Ilumatobacter sp.]|jgi:lactoylglutathione lyase|uniref:VOC family protein n=1 Tax=Ilumatobacter sp. TaxID=1967498 RepID=UPI00391A143D